MKLYGTMEITADGVLTIGKIKVTDLVKKHGTPLLVIDEEHLENRIEEYIQSFQKYYDNYQVVYGGKAFLNRTMCKILEKNGVGLDVVSGGELFIALSADYPAEDIFFHGNNKSEEELELALDHDVGRFMVDNKAEAELLNQLAGRKGKKADVILRVAPGIEAHTHEYIITGHLDSKFGVSFAGGKAGEVLQEINDYENINLQGIHAHIGSQIFELESYSELIGVLFDFLVELKEKSGIILKELDLGGGLGVAYLEEDNPPAVKQYVQLIAQAVQEMSVKKGYPLPRIIVEPGRSLIGTAGTTLYTVGSIKKVPGNSKYIAVDGGMTDNIRPALYSAQYQAIIANHCNEQSEEKVTIAGKCCESGDILIKDIALSPAKRGDVLAVPVTGAYTYSMASNYNGIPRPAVVLVKDGKDKIINRRESYEDLLQTDVLPSGY